MSVHKGNIMIDWAPIFIWLRDNSRPNTNKHISSVPKAASVVQQTVLSSSKTPQSWTRLWTLAKRKKFYQQLKYCFASHKTFFASRNLIRLWWILHDSIFYAHLGCLEVKVPLDIVETFWRRFMECLFSLQAEPKFAKTCESAFNEGKCFKKNKLLLSNSVRVQVTKRSVVTKSCFCRELLWQFKAEACITFQLNLYSKIVVFVLLNCISMKFLSDRENSICRRREEGFSSESLITLGRHWLRSNGVRSEIETRGGPRWVLA